MFVLNDHFRSNFILFHCGSSTSRTSSTSSRRIRESWSRTSMITKKRLKWTYTSLFSLLSFRMISVTSFFHLEISDLHKINKVQTGEKYEHFCWSSLFARIDASFDFFIFFNEATIPVFYNSNCFLTIYLQ